jgi:hypothetical protein
MRAMLIGLLMLTGTPVLGQSRARRRVEAAITSPEIERLGYNCSVTKMRPLAPSAV